MADRPQWQHRSYGDGQSPIFGDYTYQPGLDWLLEVCESIEDWGCGMAWARRYVPEGRYKGVDGSPEAGQYADVICDLRDRKTSVDGIFMRHVLEHNEDWDVILANAMGSFRKRFVLVGFTPWSEGDTHPTDGGLIDMSFRKQDITDHFEGFDWRYEEQDLPDSQYGLNWTFYIERSGESDAAGVRLPPLHGGRRGRVQHAGVPAEGTGRRPRVPARPGRSETDSPGSGEGDAELPGA
jgi:hypothetical protein